MKDLSNVLLFQCITLFPKEKSPSKNLIPIFDVLQL